jgi:5-methyltetrahydrofolate--homocysteine methyltransferase
MKPILQALAEGQILIADGATGTMLMAAGLQPGTAPEVWNVDNPQAILALHRDYLAAGSNIILTNTFGGSRLKLEKFGLAERIVELNQAAAHLAKQAAAGQAYVAGDLGPTGELMSPLGSLTYETAVRIFQEQAAALVAGGVDLLWVETMTDLEEARAAVTGARAVAPSTPIFASMSFGPRGKTMMGVSGKQAALALSAAGAAAIGANCGEGLEAVQGVLAQMAEGAPGLPLIAKPNAGRPKLVGGEVVYDTGPQEFAAYVNIFISAGAHIVGSCCGSNPEYIRAIQSHIR